MLPGQCLLAVYGTLRAGHPGQGRAGVDGKLRRYGAGTCLLPGVLYDCGEYPGLVAAGRDSENVVAELYVVPDAATLARLDDYEGYDPATDRGEFVRRRLRLQEPPQADCWVYFYTGPTIGKPLVIAGDWTRHLQHRASALH